MFPILFTLPPYNAGANIRPARLLVRSNTAAQQCIEATGTTVPFIGVSANRYKYAPGGFEQVAYPYLALAAGVINSAAPADGVEYKGPGQEADVITGGAITAANLTNPLTSDSQGRAITVSVPTTASTVVYIAGYPLETAAAAGAVIRMVVAQSIPLDIGAS